MTSTIAFDRATEIIVGSDGLEREIYDIFLINDDGTGLMQLTYHTNGHEFDSTSPVFSPDGSQIVFMTMRDRDTTNNTSEIYRMGRYGQNVTRLTNDAYDDDFPCWSADGTKILFAGARPDIKLYTMRSIDGGSITELPVAPGGDQDYLPSYSQDGTKVTFIRDLGGGKRAVFVANADGSNTRNLTTKACLCWAPRWSPDGQRIVYASDHHNHNPNTVQYEIYVMDAVDSNGDGEGDNRERLTINAPSVTSQNAVFSPDGTQIAYNNNSSGKFDIYFIDARGLNNTFFVGYGENCFVSDWK